MRVRATGVLVASLLLASVPSGAGAETTASCTRRATGDVLAFYGGTGAVCEHDAGASTFSVDATAYSSSPVRGTCSVTGVGAACSTSKVTLTETRQTDVMARSVTVGGTFDGAKSATGSGYAQGGSAYSSVAVYLYAYAYSCDWNWYNGWKCYYGQAKSTSSYIACTPSSCTGSQALSVTVDVPYCNGSYCNVEWSRDSPYARIVISYSVQVSASTSGYASAAAHADGIVTFD